MTRVSAAERRAALLRAAFRVIAAEGVDAATTRSIVAEAGMSLASFHYVFSSRDEMLRALITTVLEAQTVASITAVSRGADVGEAMRLGLHGFLDSVIADPHGELVMLDLMRYARRTPAIADLSQHQYASYRSAVNRLLESARTRFGVEWTLPLDDVARIVVTVTDGITLAWLADRDEAAARRVVEFAAAAIAALAAPVSSTAPPAPPAPEPTTGDTP